MRPIIVAVTFGCAAFLAGCQDGAWRGDGGQYVQPTIAVMKFENRAPFPLNWNLGGGTKDILVDRLMATGRYQVVERPELDSVLRELHFQQSGATRQQDKAALGRIKNVQYLIKGTVTDFGHVSSGRGFFHGGGWDVFGGGSRAVVSLILYVVDVESGEIIACRTVDQSVRAGDVAVKAAYGDVAFGGSAFYRTPLGRATSKVIDKAVGKITEAIAARPWEPKIALVQTDGLVIINGGKNRGLEAGWEYEVLQAGQSIHDPDTGDVIGQQPGKTLGRVRIIRVHPTYSVGDVVSGQALDFPVGSRCQRATAQTALAPRL